MITTRVRGVLDGLAQPYDLTSGLTWKGNRLANESYDWGVNIGQALARTWLRTADTFTVIRKGGRIQPADAP